MRQDQFLNRIIPLQPRLQLVAERLLGSAQAAEDAVQDVVMNLWQRRKELERVASVEAYAMQALKFHCVSELRRRRPTVDIESLPDMTDDDARREAALTEERARQLDTMLERLPEVQRRAIHLKYIQQLSYEEMQRELNMSSANVYTTLSRAVANLKQMKERERSRANLL